MFQAGDAIIYGTHGVCVISEIAELKLVGDKREYYVLSPVRDSNSKIYAPTDNEAVSAKMRKVLTRDEIMSLILNVSDDETKWISDDSERRDFCESVIKSGDRSELMKLIEMLYLKQKSLQSNKKHFHMADEKALREAQELLHDEFAYVLGIKPEEVPGYIRQQLKKAE